MLAGEWIEVEVVLAALYLPGGPRRGVVARSAWPAVCRVLRQEAVPFGRAAEVLRRNGLWGEAVVLGEPGLVAWAEEACARGRVLTAASPFYPSCWLSRLGASAPPALWRRGALPSVPFVGVVGSRILSPPARRFAADVGREAVRLGLAVVSGGAAGADRAAVRAAYAEARLAGRDAVLEILPCGLGVAEPRLGSALSLSPWEEPFLASRAMERNLLIYALADATVIVDARLRQGGTWHGAVSAMRRLKPRLLVRHDPSSAAYRALVALGAEPLLHPQALAAALASPMRYGAHAGLFGGGLHESLQGVGSSQFLDA
ncbi:MAG: DNA-processing protein DprA [Fimbriimonadaceae bacterium]|nr:DNA-processing protein DprA [Fimbriimonadaceae bacterium]